jgi:uncharacterized repeat protein (TIGR01451 family)
MRARLAGLALLALPGVAVGQPILSLTKVPTPAAIRAGDTAAFLYILQNVGNVTATGVTLTDPLPGGLAWTEGSTACSIDPSTKVLSCSLSSLPPSGTLSLTASAGTVRGDCGTLSSTASASASNAGMVQSPGTITVLCPDLSVTVIPDAPLQGGFSAAVVIVVVNGGVGTAKSAQVRAHHSTAIFGLRPSSQELCAYDNGDLVCSFGDIAALSSRSVHLEVDNDNCLPTGDTTATATATNDVSHQATATLTSRFSADADNDCKVSVLDVFYLINYLFAGGTAPK